MLLTDDEKIALKNALAFRIPVLVDIEDRYSPEFGNVRKQIDALVSAAEKLGL